MRRLRNAKILATLGPSSSTPDSIRELYEAGVDVFRINMSHGDHAAHRNRIEVIRKLEQQTGRPTAILLDLQGPKLRVGRFAAGEPGRLLSSAARPPPRPGNRQSGARSRRGSGCPGFRESAA